MDFNFKKNRFIIRLTKKWAQQNRSNASEHAQKKWLVKRHIEPTNELWVELLFRCLYNLNNSVIVVYK